MIKKSEAYKEEQAVFDELKQLIHKLGSIVAEHELLPHISKDKATQNHIHFYLVLGDAFKKHREDNIFILAGAWMTKWRRKCTNHSANFMPR